MGNTEPVITAAGIAAVVAAVIALLVAFGVNITEQQKIAILGLVAVIAPLIAGWWARQKVTPLSDPKIKLDSGESVALVREDNRMPTPQAIARTMGK